MKLLPLLLLPFSLFANSVNHADSGSAKAIAFIHSLTEDEKQKVVFPFGEMNRYEWHYLPAAMVARTGLAVKDLNLEQKRKSTTLSAETWLTPSLLFEASFQNDSAERNSTQTPAT